MLLAGALAQRAKHLHDLHVLHGHKAGNRDYGIALPKREAPEKRPFAPFDPFAPFALPIPNESWPSVMRSAPFVPLVLLVPLVPPIPSGTCGTSGTCETCGTSGTCGTCVTCGTSVTSGTSGT